MKKKYYATLIVFSAKAVKIMKAAKSLVMLKAFISVFSMSLLAAVYSWQMGVLMGVAFTLLLLIHELGHVFAMKQKGYDTHWPVFIPFIGAAIAMKELPRSRHVEAYIGFGGPLVGTAAALVCTALSFNSPFWHAAAMLGIGLNMFNMFPMSPLDGGRITQAVHRHFKLVGAAMLLAFTLFMKNPSFLVLWIIVLSDFDHIPYRVRFWFSLVLGFALLFFKLAALQGLEPVHWLDVVLGTLFALAMCWGMYRRDPNNEYKSWDDKRTLLGKRKRWMWLGAWLGLLVIQSAALVLLMVKHPH